ncbi:MAG: hypothetical protein ACRDQA_04750 [Nocardioidaceae bacterium]
MLGEVGEGKWAVGGVGTSGEVVTGGGLGGVQGVGDDLQIGDFRSAG